MFSPLGEHETCARHWREAFPCCRQRNQMDQASKCKGWAELFFLLFPVLEGRLQASRTICSYSIWCRGGWSSTCCSRACTSEDGSRQKIQRCAIINIHLFSAFPTTTHQQAFHLLIFILQHSHNEHGRNSKLRSYTRPGKAAMLSVFPISLG